MIIDQLPIETRYGWRQLKPGEIIKEGDVIADKDGIDPKDTAGDWVGSREKSETAYPVVRRIDPGPGWEIVPLDGRYEHLNEYTSNGFKWISISTATGGEMREYLGKFLGVKAVRRRKQPEAKAGWIKVGERKPPTGRILITDGKSVNLGHATDDGGIVSLGCIISDDSITDWQPLPAPPAPEINPDEEAFASEYARLLKKHTENSLAGKSDPKSVSRELWQAALAYARKPNWIKCTDRLPSDSCDVWAYAGGEAAKAHYQGGWYYSTGFAVATRLEGVTHWHEIKAPAAPEERQ